MSWEPGQIRLFWEQYVFIRVLVFLIVGFNYIPIFSMSSSDGNTLRTWLTSTENFQLFSPASREQKKIKMESHRKSSKSMDRLVWPFSARLTSDTELSRYLGTSRAALVSTTHSLRLSTQSINILHRALWSANVRLRKSSSERQMLDHTNCKTCYPLMGASKSLFSQETTNRHH